MHTLYHIEELGLLLLGISLLSSNTIADSFLLWRHLSESERNERKKEADVCRCQKIWSKRHQYIFEQSFVWDSFMMFLFPAISSPSPFSLLSSLSLSASFSRHLSSLSLSLLSHLCPRLMVCSATDSWWCRIFLRDHHWFPKTPISLPRLVRPKALLRLSAVFYVAMFYGNI